MIRRLLVPSGIGDFSWTWSKLSTTGHHYHIEYVGGEPDRMKAYLSMLPKDKIVGFNANHDYYTKWDKTKAPVKLEHVPRNPTKAARLLDIKNYVQIESSLVYLESNTHLEAGNRLEKWMQSEIPNTDFHYKIEGVLAKPERLKYFIVNFSSYGTKKAWGYYEVKDSADIVAAIVKMTGWMPLFIGGTYDDYTIDIYKELCNRGIGALNVVGKTPNLIDATVMLQQSQMYFGACSGLMVLANVLYVPVCCYYPPFKEPPGRFLAGTWHDTSIPYLSLFWEGKEKEIVEIEKFVKHF